MWPYLEANPHNTKHVGSQCRIITTRDYSTLCLKNASTLASSSFDKHGTTVIIFGKQHQHTFRNDMHIQLSLYLHFYLLSRGSRERERLHATGLSICSSVCLYVCRQNGKKRYFIKTKQFRAMVSVDDL